MFPLGDLWKTEVKKIAREAGMDRISRKRESTGICFVGKRNFDEFIREVSARKFTFSKCSTFKQTDSYQYIEDKPGNFIDFDTGKILGSHNGIHYWTLGQRCRIVSNPKPMFILTKNSVDNSIIVTAGTDHPALFTDIVYTGTPYWIVKNPMDNGNIIRCLFRFQHTKELVNCVMVRTGSGGLLVKLDKALRALTPGQYAVFYRDGECLGSARITDPGPSLYFCPNK